MVQYYMIVLVLCSDVRYGERERVLAERANERAGQCAIPGLAHKELQQREQTGGLLDGKLSTC